MITVVASLKVAPGKRAEFLPIFKSYAEIVRTEKGCVEYAPGVDIDANLPVQQFDENVVTLVERWHSVDDLVAHLNAPAMQSFKAQVDNLLEDLSVKVLQTA
ncbi:antibiotic biosynthesis monooxygenase [Geomonas sp. RF6]|uniref:putative quinol monooxygenase n=1 Tax=Geomonas sp. RF6 TaxID=2897342 RepID=UPI001E5E4369|nr:putative quinol monooxygenase [Geomonas sp. RF6]UFS72373.1 antibiotic biosynthesis monooxygenase [Geomonas sp. RF6]